jgi:hydroxymethylpyrimidine/phosphomethylpyrimidine kinase
MALGVKLEDAIQTAKLYVTRALANAEPVGHGATPLNHLIKPEEIKGRR